jgi:hypothetical protein
MIAGVEENVLDHNFTPSAKLKLEGKPILDSVTQITWACITYAGGLAYFATRQNTTDYATVTSETK